MSDIKDFINAASEIDGPKVPAFAFHDDGRASKPGKEAILAKFLGNQVSGIVREVKLVDVSSMKGDNSTEKKLLIRLALDSASKGFTKETGEDAEPLNLASTPEAILWVNGTGNLIAMIRKACGDSIRNGQQLTVKLIDCKQTGKANGAFQYEVTAGPVSTDISEMGADDID